MQKNYEALGERLYQKTLENGLSIYVIPKEKHEKKYAFFATSYGGADQRFCLDGVWQDSPAGVAHFLEHELFDTEEGNALMDLSANGASPNAFTSADLTAYYFECSDQFWENLEILLRFVSVPYFTEESIVKERGIITQEIGMVEDNPDYVMYFNLLKCLYAQNPVRDSVAGTVESIGEISVQTLYDLHQVFYRPSNMVLCAVGDISIDRLAEVAERILPKDLEEIPQKDYGTEGDEPFANARMEAFMAVSKPSFLAGIRVPVGQAGADVQRLELCGSLAMQYLAGKSSPLYMRLYKRGLVGTDFTADFTAAKGYAFASVGGESDDEQSVLQAVKDEIAHVLDAGMDELRFARLKRANYGKMLRGLDDAETLCYEQTISHFQNAIALDKPEILEAIKAQDVLDFIRENLKAEHVAVSVIRPKK